MSDHIIQKRDLLEMLSRHDDKAEIIVERPGDDSAADMTIDRVEAHCGRISIHVHDDGRIEELEESNEKLEGALKKADLLLERLQTIDSYVEQSDKDEDMLKLMEDVEKYLDER